MITCENIETMGWKAAIRGMRNPMDSWDKSDSVFCDPEGCGSCRHECSEDDGVRWEDPDLDYCVGIKDLKLMQKLYRGGTEHRKFLRMITIQMDVTAPIYWWKEFDTYKVGTVANSCSTMHKLMSRPLKLDDFSLDGSLGDSYIEETIRLINSMIRDYNDYYSYEREWIRDITDPDEIPCPSRDQLWRTAVQLLPMCYNQRRTIQMNYETAASILHQREHHKLTEWHTFCYELRQLPYLEDIIDGN